LALQGDIMPSFQEANRKVFLLDNRGNNCFKSHEMARLFPMAAKTEKKIYSSSFTASKP
jgi:hypothetical protein